MHSVWPVVLTDMNHHFCLPMWCLKCWDHPCKQSIIIAFHKYFFLSHKNTWESMATWNILYETLCCLRLCYRVRNYVAKHVLLVHFSREKSHERFSASAVFPAKNRTNKQTNNTCFAFITHQLVNRETSTKHYQWFIMQTFSCLLPKFNQNIIEFEQFTAYPTFPETYSSIHWNEILILQGRLFGMANHSILGKLIQLHYMRTLCYIIESSGNG